MSRTINNSIEVLKKSLNDIKTSLTAKKVGGGAESLKVSEVANLIDQIETGGGGKAVVAIVGGVKFNELSNVTIYDFSSSNYISVYAKNGSSYSKIYINFYEVEPSESSYNLFANNEEGGKYSKTSVKFTEPKLYVIKADDYEYYS